MESSSIGASGKARRRKDGVANCFLVLLGVSPSCSRFRFNGVPAKASKKRRRPEDCGVTEAIGADDGGAVDGLLGVALTADISNDGGSEDGLEGVAEGMSKMPSTCPSFCGVGPRAHRMKAGVASISCSSSSATAASNVPHLTLLLGVAFTALPARSRKAVLLCALPG